jgi:glycosyltransferase involved in cell wall biosynthesis
MKVAILADEIVPGSAPKILGQPIRGLRQLGYDASGLVLVRKEAETRYADVFRLHLEGIPLRYLFENFPPWVRALDFKFPGFSFFSAHHLLAYPFAPGLVREKEYDLIVAQCQYSTFTARALKARRKIPYLLLMWDPSPYTLEKVYTGTPLQKFFPVLKPLTRALDRFAFKEAEALIVSGRLHHERLRKVTDKPLEDLYPGCVIPDEYVPFSRREKAVLTYDRWDIGNRPEPFLAILAALDRSIRLIVGGFWHPARLQDEFRAALKQRGLEDRVELLGPLDENEIIRLCSRAMLHLHLNEEAFGMQTLEAAACGTPIIIPRGSGVTDLFRDGVHGFFPEKNRLPETVERVKSLFSDPARAEAMGQAAREEAKKHDWDAHSRRLAEIIERYKK